MRDLSPLLGRWALLAITAALLCVHVGCGGSSDPKSYPVQGKIVFKGKGNIRQLVGGKVRCQSVSDSSLTAVGEIEDDGSFSLGAFLKDKGLPGVHAGQYKARLEPPRSIDDDEDKRPRVTIPRKYLDYDKSGFTFTVPVSGDIVLEVEGTGR